MLKEFAETIPVYLVTGRTDMRKGIEGLVILVSTSLGQDPHNGSLFLFCGRDKRNIKGLIWEEDGFLLLTKKLGDGRYCWPSSEEEVVALTKQQIRWLLEGLAIEQNKAIRGGKKYKYI